MSCPLCKPAPAAHLWREREKTLAWEGPGPAPPSGRPGRRPAPSAPGRPACPPRSPWTPRSGSACTGRPPSGWTTPTPSPCAGGTPGPCPGGCPSPWPSCSRRGFGGGAGCWRRPPGSCGPGRHPGSPASGRTGSAAWPAASIRSGFSSRRRGRRCSSPCTPWGPMWRASPPFRSASPRKRKRRFPPNFRACLKHVNMPNRRAFCPLDSAIFP